MVRTRFNLPRLRPIHVVFFFAASYVVFVGYDAVHSTGQIGSTKKNGDGCTCHGDHLPTDSVSVWISGPDTVSLGDAAQYTLYMKGGPAIAGGFNVAADRGSLSVIDSTSRLLAGELTHNVSKTFSNDTVSWKFMYHAPLSGSADTIFSVANSVNLDGIPSGDQYNFGANFTVRLSDTTTGVGDEYHALTFRLYQNFPNPFNPVTVIRYSVAGNQVVTVKVFDVRGKEISTLAQGTSPAGEYEVEFNSANFPSGIYFYSLTSGSFSMTKKMLLIR